MSAEVRLLWGPAWRVVAEAPRVPVVVDVYSLAHGPGSRSFLELGSAAFDAAYGVDGAPEPIVRELLDEDVRERIGRLSCERLQIRDGLVDIRKRHHFHFDEHREMGEALELAADLAAQVGALSREAEAALVREAGRAAGPYRGGPDPGVLASLTAARDHEVSAARRRTRRRWNKSRAAAGALIGGWFLFELVVRGL